VLVATTALLACFAIVIHVGARLILHPGFMSGRQAMACRNPWQPARVDTGGVTLAVCVRSQSDPTRADAVFLLHGGGDNKSSFYDLGDRLFAEGFSVVVLDSRGHGESTGDTLTYGAFEANDLVNVRTTLFGRGSIPEHVSVLGYSYGAATALMWAARDPRVAVVVAVAPFSSLYDVAPHYAGGMPAPIVRGAAWWAGKLGGFDPSDSPEARAARVNAPTLVIHGGSDANIPPDESRAIAARLPNGTLEVLDGMTHHTMFDDPRVWDLAFAWLRTHRTKSE
jgi:pimeloyl-ACP methyl ester carboxylesterase